MDGEQNREGCPLAWCALHRNGSPMLIHDELADRETKPRAITFAIRIEGLEDLGLLLWGDAPSRILELDRHDRS